MGSGTSKKPSRYKSKRNSHRQKMASRPRSNPKRDYDESKIHVVSKLFDITNANHATR